MGDLKGRLFVTLSGDGRNVPTWSLFMQHFISVEVAAVEEAKKGREGRGIVNAADNQSIVLINDLIDDFINRREWIDNGDMEITCRARHVGPAHISRRMLFKLRDCR